MRRALVIVGVWFGSALRGAQSSPLPTGIAVLTIGLALLLVGTFVLAVGNMQSLLTRFGEELHVVVYLDGGLSEAEQKGMVTKVETIEGVDSVALVTREEALARFRDSMGGADLLAGLDSNPLPPSLEIELAPDARTEAGMAVVTAALDGLPGVSELSHGQQWVQGYARAASLVRSAAWVLGGTLSFAALLIVANTIRLAVYAREDELEILALVGAGRVFQRAPFLIEGAAQGALGGVLALTLLWIGFQTVLPQLEYGLVLFLGQSTPRFFAGGEAAALVLGGAALGVLGSGFAVAGWRR